MGAETVAAHRVAWWALAVSPALTATTQLASYALASQACSDAGRAMMIALVVVSALVTAAAGWYSWQHSRDDDALHTGRHTSESVVAFTWHLALLVNAFFGIVIVAFVVPPLLLHACH